MTTTDASYHPATAFHVFPTLHFTSASQGGEEREREREALTQRLYRATALALLRTPPHIEYTPQAILSPPTSETLTPPLLYNTIQNSTVQYCTVPPATAIKGAEDPRICSAGTACQGGHFTLSVRMGITRGFPGMALDLRRIGRSEDVNIQTPDKSINQCLHGLQPHVT